jgi:hypothetical protein
VIVTLDGSQRKVQLASEHLGSLRLAYTQHVYRQQGATVERSVVLTGGWQTSKETAYVEATRARHRTDWFIARDDLGEEGQDPNESHGSPSVCAAAAPRPHRSRTASYPIPAGEHDSTSPGFGHRASHAGSTHQHGTSIARLTAARTVDAESLTRNSRHQDMSTSIGTVKMLTQVAATG